MDINYGATWPSYFPSLKHWESYCLVYFCKEKLLQYYEKNHEFQASVTERCTTLSKSSGIFMLNPFKVPVKKIKL